MAKTFTFDQSMCEIIYDQPSLTHTTIIIPHYHQWCKPSSRIAVKPVANLMDAQWSFMTLETVSTQVKPSSTTSK